MAKVTRPTREQLREIFPDQRRLRAFEQLFSALDRIEASLDLLELAPASGQDASPALESIDMDRLASIEHKDGRIWWNDRDDTLNIGHSGGVTQQVGQETYMHVENVTGSPIANGAVVGFDGANGYIRVAPFLANGALPSEYFIGVATQDLAVGEVGMATLYGRVRGFDTTGAAGGETWANGQILYASPTIAGYYTNVRPTAPSEVVILAIVLVVSATAGEVMVRTIVPTGLAYATYYSTIDQSPTLADTAYPISFNSAGLERDVILVAGTRLTVSQAGLYTVNVKLQCTSSTASSSTLYAWLALNGTDIADSRADFTIKANGDTKLVSYVYQISLIVGDYLEVKWASSTVNLRLDAIPATSFAPAASSASVFLTQIQL